MNVPDRLTAALEDRARQAHAGADALDRIRAQVGVRRRTRRLRVAGAVTAAAAVVLATPALLQRPERAGLTTPAPTTAPAVPPTAAPTATSDVWMWDFEFPVVTADRTLALVSPKTGEITRTVTTFTTMPWSVDLNRDGTVALVVLPKEKERGCGQVVEVDTRSHARRTLTTGYAAQYNGLGDQIAVVDCANAVRIVQGRSTAITIRHPGPDNAYGSVAWSKDGHLYVQEYGDDSNALYRFFPPADRTLADGERVVTTYFTTMNVPVPWQDTLLHTDSAQHTPGRSEVRAARSYTMDEYVDRYDVLFTVPHGIDGLAVSSRDEVLVSAGGSFWLWTGKGEAKRIGKAYPVFGW